MMADKLTNGFPTNIDCLKQKIRHNKPKCINLPLFL